ncbi:BgTH12-03908 [Blumeria graminis f. sp. triticale]|uniref:BgTH12-03908 n=1 Tax=Blumeria graminis f. sp. triticale TaxID=1689686 RepID=A0A9W4CWI3_BLUGR|nr:BgTH12-03908 [Blumeria graminis f. sp. triticale]
MVPGVTIPSRFMQMLSLNGKFISHTQMDPKFVENAMTQLYRSIRIRWLFRDKSDNPYYIPKFHVKTPGWEPPRANSRIEKAIDAVRESLCRQTPQLPQSAHLRNPEIKSLRDFSRDESYLVKITHKNLGLAVVTKSWYCNEITTHISNTDAYQLVGLVHLHDINMKFKSIVRNHVFSTVIKKYLNETTTELPRFHVIPKIHKIPWSSRPIIPSHSWITSRASEVIDYFIQPYLKNYPFELNSTKSFLAGLRKIASKMHSLEGCILASGDVKAMYTNIDPCKALESAKIAINACYRKGNSTKGIEKLLEFILRYNFFEYEHDVYKQKSGLAMVTSCALAVANLFVANLEKNILPHLY